MTDTREALRERLLELADIEEVSTLASWEIAALAREAAAALAAPEPEGRAASIAERVDGLDFRGDLRRAQREILHA